MFHPALTATVFCCALQVAPWLPAEAAGLSSPEANALFQRLRVLESESHVARVGILETAEACIQGAADFRAYRACERSEREAREALRESIQPRRKAIRDEFRALRARRDRGSPLTEPRSDVEG